MSNGILRIKFIYDNVSQYPMVDHDDTFECPHSLGIHNIVECGDVRIFQLAKEAGNPLYRQPLLEKRNKQSQGGKG